MVYIYEKREPFFALLRLFFLVIFSWLIFYVVPNTKKIGATLFRKYFTPKQIKPYINMLHGIHYRITSWGKSPFSIWEFTKTLAARCNGVGSLSAWSNISTRIIKLGDQEKKILTTKCLSANRYQISVLQSSHEEFQLKLANQSHWIYGQQMR